MIIQLTNVGNRVTGMVLSHSCIQLMDSCIVKQECLNYDVSTEWYCSDKV